MPASLLNYAGVQALLDAAIGGPNQQIGFHGAFWRNLTRDQFVAFQYRQVFLIKLGDPSNSGLVQALEGSFPFGQDDPIPVPSAKFNRMPDGGPYMAAADIGRIRDWIKNMCPA